MLHCTHDRLVMRLFSLLYGTHTLGGTIMDTTAGAAVGTMNVS